MNILFIHQNFPGQFRHLASHLAQDRKWQVVGLCDASNMHSQRELPGVTTLGYRITHKEPTGHAYLRGLETQVRRGQAVLRSLLELKRKGFEPQVICAHPSWGEALFLREAFPDSKIICYSEFFYRAQGSDVGFDPEFQDPGLDFLCRLRLRNTVHLQSLDTCDHAWTPSQWQAGQMPAAFRERCSVIHEGIDTEQVRPDPGARFRYNGLSLTASDSVLTYVARNLEPYRGFHVFMRALPSILATNPQTQVVIVGGDEVSYGAPPKDAPNWREKMLAEVGDALDLSRVHFLGKLPYADYLTLLQVSTAHVYLTYPFVLSWSLLEAMAVGCAIVASRTAPVEEVIVDGENGLLVGFFDTAALAKQVSRLLEEPEVFQTMRRRARETVLARYELKQVCLPMQVETLQSLLER